MGGKMKWMCMKKGCNYMLGGWGCIWCGGSRDEHGGWGRCGTCAQTKRRDVDGWWGWGDEVHKYKR